MIKQSKAMSLSSHIKIRFLMLLLVLITILSTVTILTLPQETVLSSSGDWQISANADDCRMYYSGGWVFSNSANENPSGANSAVSITRLGSGLRFQGVTLPQGATITNAYISLRASASKSATTVNSYIQGEDTDNAIAFSTSANYQNRRGLSGGTDNTTTAIVAWDNIGAWTANTWYNSPNISTVVQEIVDRPGWSSGNALVIFWDDHDNRSTYAANVNRGGWAHDYDPSSAVKLYVVYSIALPPTVVTNTATNVEETTVTLNGNVTNTGNGNVSCRGFAWDTSTHGTPNSSTSPATSLYTTGNWTECSGYAAGAYSHNVTALTKGELYYYRAASNNSNGYGWGNESTFLTKPDEPNTFVATNNATACAINLSWVKGTGAGNTEIWGQSGSYPAARGTGTMVYNSTGTTYGDTNPTAGQTWYYRAWSYTTEGGLFRYSDTYDEDNEQLICLPTIVTNSATLVEETSMTLNGNITATGGENLSDRGFEWGLNTGSYTANWTESGSWGTGAYTHGLTSLTEGELYYLRAMGNNSQGWGYGSEVKVLTKPDAPSNLGDTDIGSNWVALSWTTNNGSDQTMLRYKTGSYPTDETDGTQGYFGAASTCNVTSLSPATLYYFRAWAYAAEDGETQYSDDYTSDTATTSAAVNPVLTTLNATLVEETTATLNGNITQINDGIITDRGFSYDTNSGEPYSLNVSYNGSFGLGTYTGNITSLSPGTLYYFRGEATNNVSETGYGAELTLLTKPNPPINITVTAYTYNDISLSWTKGSGADNTYIRYKTSGYPANTSDGTLGYNNIGTSTTINSLSSGQIYYFRAWSYTTSGIWSHYSDNTSDVTDYTSPGDITGFDAYNPSESAIDLSWTKGTGGDSTHIRGQIGSYPTNVSAGTQIYFSTGSSDTHTSLACNTSWYYRAWAYDTDSGYYSDTYDSDYATTTACPVATPTPTPM